MHFYYTLADKGSILEVAVRKKYKVAEAARKMDIERSTMYLHFKNPDLSDRIIYDYTRKLGLNLSEQFPDLLQYANQVQEPLHDYKPITLADALKEADTWKDKYLKLLEKYNELLESRNSSITE